MKKYFIWSLLFSLFITIAIPTAMETNIAVAQNITVTGDTVNIRTGPGLSYGVVTKVKKNDTLTVLKEKGDWIQVQTVNGKKGWIAGWLTAKKNSTITTNQTAEILNNGLRVRSGAGTTNKVLGTVQKGETYKVLQSKNGWIQIDSPFGKGWISKDYATIIDSSTSSSGNGKGKNVTPTIIGTGKVTASVLNVRESASTNATIVGKLNKGATVSIISQSASWTNILFNGSSAWVSSQYVDKSSNSSTEVNTTSKVKITASVLKVRSSNSLNASEVGKVTKNQTFSVLEEKNDWVKIEYTNGKTGWIAAWYTEKVANSSNPQETTGSSSKQEVTILNNGTNIRKQATTNSSVVYRASKGEQFEIVEQSGDWYEIKLDNGSTGFVAGWIISINGKTSTNNQTATEKYLSGKTIVIDAGHGGRDSGTIGISGTQEKGLTLTVAKQLQNALSAAGANVVMTRKTDTYVSLANRVYLSSRHKADAFISVHFDSINDSSIRGLTTYYYHSNSKQLANKVHESTVSSTGMKNRNARYGNYYVLRENSRPSILMELGYLSNRSDEAFVKTASFQSNAVKGIVTGLANYFK